LAYVEAEPSSLLLREECCGCPSHASQLGWQGSMGAKRAAQGSGQNQALQGWREQG